MSPTRLRGMLAPTLSVLLLLIGSAAAIFGFLLFGLVTGALGERGAGLAEMTVYYRVVVLKGLLPQLVLTLALHPLVRRARVRWATPATRAEAAAPGHVAVLLELLVASALCYCAVAPFLLTLDFESWPALQMTTAGQQITTFVLMTTVTGVAAWLPRVLPGPWRSDVAPGAA